MITLVFSQKQPTQTFLGGSVDVQIVYFMDENLAQFNRKYYLLLMSVQQYQLGCGNSDWEYKLGLIA